LKPSECEQIMQEIEASASRWNPKMLRQHQVFSF
jgi:hypothetical protein